MLFIIIIHLYLIQVLFSGNHYKGEDYYNAFPKIMEMTFRFLLSVE